MNQEDYFKLKEKIELLSEEEKRERDKYLKQLATGELQGPPTGYPSIDKPQLKYYREKPIKEINPNESIYEMIFNHNNRFASALSFLGTTWSYGKLKRETDKCADALVRLGIKQGDNVLIGTINTLETVALLLALEKIGAVSVWFDLRASAEDIAEYANENNCKYMVSIDANLERVKGAINKTNLKKVYIMRPESNLIAIKKKIYEKQQKENGKYIYKPLDQRFEEFSSLMETGNPNTPIAIAPFDKKRASIKIMSSGTTGKQKIIAHPSYSATEFARVLSYSDLPAGKRKTLLSALPPWIAYGLGDALLWSLAVGTKVELSPTFDPDAVYKNLGKFSISFGAPFHYRYIRDIIPTLSPKQKKRLYRQLKKAECFVTGGDKIGTQENKELEEATKTALVNGYGDNEGWGALTVNPKKANRYGSVGIPIYGSTIIVYDEETGMELPYGQEGEICALTNTMFLDYVNNPEKTAETKVIHKDGKCYLHTGDLGYIDKDGFVYVTGRKERVIVRQGFKLSPYNIEEVITSLPYIKECITVSVPDDIEETVPMAFVVVNENIEETPEEIIEILRDDCKGKLAEHKIPKHFMVLPKLPTTSNNKYDFRKMEQMGKEYVARLSESQVIKKEIKLN